MGTLRFFELCLIRSSIIFRTSFYVFLKATFDVYLVIKLQNNNKVSCHVQVNCVLSFPCWCFFKLVNMMDNEICSQLFRAELVIYIFNLSEYDYSLCETCTKIFDNVDVLTRKYFFFLVHKSWTNTTYNLKIRKKMLKFKRRSVFSLSNEDCHQNEVNFFLIPKAMIISTSSTKCSSCRNGEWIIIT